MTPPDAWDECGYCGHDYDDHDEFDCRGFKDGHECLCPGFQEAA